MNGGGGGSGGSGGDGGGSGGGGGDGGGCLLMWWWWKWGGSDGVCLWEIMLRQGQSMWNTCEYGHFSSFLHISGIYLLIYKVKIEQSYIRGYFCVSNKVMF